jgi:hypothetical protein
MGAIFNQNDAAFRPLFGWSFFGKSAPYLHTCVAEHTPGGFNDQVEHRAARPSAIG